MQMRCQCFYSAVMANSKLNEARPKPRPEVASLAREDLLSRAAVTLTCTAGNSLLAKIP